MQGKITACMVLLHTVDLHHIICFVCAVLALTIVYYQCGVQNNVHVRRFKYIVSEVMFSGAMCLLQHIPPILMEELVIHATTVTTAEM